ncbi:MAG: flagellin [Hyphomicrobiaceae bacterium]
MNSIKTNFAAMTALQTLNMTNRDMLTTQNRISTGYRVASAEDNAAYWSMATTMRSDNKALSAVSDALGLGAATLDTTYTAINKAIDVTSEIKAKLVAARQPGVDLAKVQTEIDALQDQLRSTAGSASFSGENWLSVDTGGTDYNAAEDVVASFTRSATGVSVGIITINVSASYLFDSNTDGAGVVNGGAATAGALGILGSARLDSATAATADLIGTIDDTGTIVIANFSVDPTALTPAGNANAVDEFDLNDITAGTAAYTVDDVISATDRAITEMTTAATNIGAAKSRVKMQQEFVQTLMDSIDRGVATLVDADMNEESTRLQALQVQQQLGIQSLSIANSAAQNILSLFRQ